MTSNNTLEESTLSWQIRPFNQQDIPGIAALFDAADRADHLYKLSSTEDITETFADTLSDPTTHVIVATDPSQPNILGLGRLTARFHTSTNERVYHVTLRVHPSARPQGLQHTIARHLVEIARDLESDPSTQPAEKVRVLSYLFDRQTSSIDAWENLGLRPVRTGWTMERKLSDPIQAHPIPDNITLRTYNHPQDNQPALDAFNTALADYYDFHPVPQTSWEREMAAPYSRPDLSWLAHSNTAPNTVIGLAGCQVNESANKQANRLEGWIEGIGVIPPFRNIGVGKALLSHSLQSFRDEGLDFALTDVDSESLPAVHLFKSAGFTVRIALLQYECPLTDIRL